MNRPKPIMCPPGYAKGAEPWNFTRKEVHEGKTGDSGAPTTRWTGAETAQRGTPIGKSGKAKGAWT